MDYLEKIKEATKAIQSKSNYQPTIGLILGSGLGDLANQIKNPEKYPYSEIPHFAVSTVKGHSGQLVIGELEGKQVIAMQGRIHYYEGYGMKKITFPVRVMKALGVDIIIVTNAAGGISQHLYVGALMLISDHINFFPENPLRGHNFESLGVRFPDMAKAYDRDLQTLAIKIAKEEDIKLEKGVYTAVTGPTYETEAEMKMLKYIGADAVGMSTIPEVIVARHADMRVLGISAITDMTGTDAGVSHAEVIEVANQIKPNFIHLVKSILREL